MKLIKIALVASVYFVALMFIVPQTARADDSCSAFLSDLAVAETALGNALAAAQSQAIGGTGKSALAESIAKARSLLGNATALSGSTSISDKQAVAKSLAQATTVLGDALAIAQSDAISGPGKPAIAKSLAIAKISVDTMSMRNSYNYRLPFEPF